MVNEATSGGGIELRRLSKSYGSVHAVRSIDLTIAPAERSRCSARTAQARRRLST
jgi:hypothetical protein